MGGALALALRDKCAGLLGVDTDRRTRELARERKVVDIVAADPGEVLPQAEVIILATPVLAILSILRDLPQLHPGDAVVIDIGSTKEEITDTMAHLPSRFDPIGAHPMCGKERSSLAFAEGTLFQGSTFALAPLARTTQRARGIATQIVDAIGAEPFWLDPAAHDRWVAATSHLPFLVSNALASSTPLEVAPLVGPGFCSTSRLAPSSIDMFIDIIKTNRGNITAAVERYQERLSALGNAILEEDYRTLESLLEQGADQYRRLVPGQAKEGD